jgi:hypothetical protein
MKFFRANFAPVLAGKWQGSSVMFLIAPVSTEKLRSTKSSLSRA